MTYTARLLLVACMVFAAASATTCAQEKGVFLDPEKAGPDYDVQGEYVGELQGRDREIKLGAQVIALGDAKFRLVLLGGGLPGDGWSRGDRTIVVEGQTKEGVTEFVGESGLAKITKGSMTIYSRSGEERGTFKKVYRKSPTLGAKPPKDAIVLFDGKSADEFNHGEITEDKLLRAHCDSKRKFGDHKLHIEFRTPFKPHGREQGRGNSGVYVQGRYEVQVLDSFGLEGKNNECGGIYSISEPKVNMCFPPLSWQTYDIDFTAAHYEGDKKVKNARVTIRHNGVVIHDDLELPKGTPGFHAEGPGPDSLYLQGHGNPVVYRNIWVVEK